MVTFVPSTVTLRAPDSCGSPEASAIRAGTTDSRVSVASTPAITRSGLKVPMALASTFAVVIAHEPCRASSVT